MMQIIVFWQIVIWWILALFAPIQHITIIQCDTVQDSIAHSVAKAVAHEFNANVTVIYGLLPKDAYSHAFNMYDGDKFLEIIKDYPIDGKIMVMTNQPLIKVTGWHVGYGLNGIGIMNGNSSVITGDALQKDSLVKEFIVLAYHELGHNYGLVHCADTTCYMNGSGVPASKYGAYTHYCDKCLKKLYKSIL